MRNGRFRRPDAGKLLRALQKSLRRRVSAGHQSPAVASIVRAEESRLNAALALESADFFSGQVRDGWLRLASLWEALAKEQEQLLRLTCRRELH